MKHAKDKNSSEAHDKHNLRKYSHYVQCTKTLVNESKRGVWGNKMGLKALVLVPKQWEKKNQNQREDDKKIQQNRPLIDHSWSITNLVIWSQTNFLPI